MIENNFAKQKLLKGEPVIGMWNTIGSPMVTEVLAAAGMDFLIVDFEHGPFQMDQVPSYVNACERYGCSPIVRIPSNAPWMVLQSLDLGAHGVVVPHIDSSNEAQILGAASRYYPRGNRGFTPFTKAGGFTGRTVEQYTARATDFPLVVAIIESREALDDLDAILEQPEIDVLYFGAYDLSQALGCPGEVRSKKVVDAISAAVSRAQNAGKLSGAFVAQSPDDIKWQLDLGLRLITYNVDTAVLLHAVQDIVGDFRNL
jgi:4-hydroxy-2-oxoheptanedioate aldolase